MAILAMCYHVGTAMRTCVACERPWASCSSAPRWSAFAASCWASRPRPRRRRLHRPRRRRSRSSTVSAPTTKSRARRRKRGALRSRWDARCAAPGIGTEALAELRRALALAGDRPQAAAAVDWELARAYVERHDIAQRDGARAKLEKAERRGGRGARLRRGRGARAAREPRARRDGRGARARSARFTTRRSPRGARTRSPSTGASRGVASERRSRLRPDDAEAHFALGACLASAARGRPAKTKALRRAAPRRRSSTPTGPTRSTSSGRRCPGRRERASLLERRDARAALVRGRVARARATQLLAAGAVDRGARRHRRGAVARPGARRRPRAVGAIALAQGRADDAIRAGQAVLQSSANSAAAKLLVADGNAKKGEIDAALEAYQAAWGLDHADPAPLVHASRGVPRGRPRHERAGLRREGAAQEFPNWAPAWAALGDALAAQRRRSAARDAYRKALGGGDGPVDRERASRRSSRPP